MVLTCRDHLVDHHAGTLNNNSFNNGGAVWAAATFNNHRFIPVIEGMVAIMGT